MKTPSLCYAVWWDVYSKLASRSRSRSRSPQLLRQHQFPPNVSGRLELIKMGPLNGITGDIVQSPIPQVLLFY